MRTILHRRVRGIPTLFAVILAIGGMVSGQTAATLNLDLNRPKAAVSSTLYGLMTEEINYSYDGGLYAELVRNRIFKDDAEKPAHWSVVQDNNAAGSIS